MRRRAGRARRAARPGPAPTRGRGGLGQPVGPGLAGQRLPDGVRGPAAGAARRAARARAGSAPSAGSSRSAAGVREPARRRAATAASASTRACRGGTARRRTSASTPAYRSATARHSAATSGVSTGSGETTLSSQASRPACSVSATRSSTNPSTSRPANRTRTRTPGTAASSRCAGTRSRRAGRGARARRRPRPGPTGEASPASGGHSPSLRRVASASTASCLPRRATALLACARTPATIRTAGRPRDLDACRNARLTVPRHSPVDRDSRADRCRRVTELAVSERDSPGASRLPGTSARRRGRCAPTAARRRSRPKCPYAAVGA